MAKQRDKIEPTVTLDAPTAPQRWPRFSVGALALALAIVLANSPILDYAPLPASAPDWGDPLLAILRFLLLWMGSHVALRLVAALLTSLAMLAA